MKKTMLLLVIMMLGLTAAAFAQVGFTARTESITTVVKSGHTELTGDIQLVVAPNNTFLAMPGTFALQYSVPVTSPMDAAHVSVTGTGGLLGLVQINPDSSGPDGLLIINVNAALTGTAVASGDAIKVHGVRVDAASSTTNTVAVSITSTGNLIENGQFTANVINGMKTGLVANADDSTSVSINGLDPGSGTAQLIFVEGFLNAFGKTAASDTTQTTSQMVRIQLSAAPPAGATITFPATASSQAGGSASWHLSDSAGAFLSSQEVDDTATGADLEAWYILVSNNNATLIEDFIVNVAVDATDADVPVPAGIITARATLSPNKDAFVKDSVEGLPIPRYAVDWTDALDVVTFKGNTTALLVPLFMSKTVEVPQWGPGPAFYDTGLAIANTTSDPGKSLMGVDSAAIKQSGKINFYIFLQGETTPVTYTTGAASPGSGLDAAGNLPAGSTYIVLASEILTAAGLDVTENFQGYMIVVTNFTNAHGIEYVGDFIHVMQTSAMHVIKPKRQDVPEGLDQ